MNTYEYQKLRGLKRKLYLIEQRGGCCEECGYDKNLAAFDFHHKDPNEKESQLDMRKLSNSKMEWILEEFGKCKVLCSNCHRETHSPDLEIKKVRLLVESMSNKINQVREIKKPKCLDCGDEINYQSTRCKGCNDKNKRKVERPNINVLKNEFDKNGVTWCSKKYKVSRRSIHRWINKD